MGSVVDAPFFVSKLNSNLGDRQYFYIDLVVVLVLALVGKSVLILKFMKQSFVLLLCILFRRAYRGIQRQACQEESSKQSCQFSRAIFTPQSDCNPNCSTHSDIQVHAIRAMVR